MKGLMLALAGLMLTTGVAMAELINIDNDQLIQLRKQQIPLIDVRTSPEWQETGVVEGSLQMTFFDSRGQYDAKAWLEALGPVAGKDDPVILICRTGRRTGLIGNFLTQQVGYTRVYHVAQGIRGWIEKGNPVVSPQ